MNDIRIGDRVELSIDYPMVGGTVNRKVQAKFVDTIVGKPNPITIRRYYGLKAPPDAFDAKPFVRHVFLRDNGHHIVAAMGRPTCRVKIRRISK